MSAPASASDIAIPFPMPLPAPVTTATSSSRLNKFKIDYTLVKDELELMMEQGYQNPKAELPGSPADDERSPDQQRGGNHQRFVTATGCRLRLR